MDKAIRKPIRLIKQSDIRKHFGMSEAIDAMAAAFSKLSAGECFVPKRTIASTRDKALNLLLKPAFIRQPNRAGIKILTQKTKAVVPGIPTILGIVLLIDTNTGEILSIMDGEYITALRTGAASGLATKYLSRKESKTVAIFGCGSQGKTQLTAVNAVRDIQQTFVFDRSAEAGEAFIDEMSSMISSNIQFTDDLSLLREVDIVCTATNAETPLFSKEHLKPGVHINAIGSFKPNMQEIDPKIIQVSRCYFDDREACLKETGDFLRAKDSSKLSAENIIGEIGDVVLGNIPARTSPDEITLFKSVGTAIQDLEVANRIYEKSLQTNFGREIKLYE